jgi:NADPH:quinone reductase-like Zn-dependent oxidoreductase
LVGPTGPGEASSVMKAIVYRKFGSPQVLNVERVAAPALAADHVLVSMRASSVNGIDSRSRRGQGWPLVSRQFPKTPGVDVAGIVTEVGANVRTLKAGDRVFGATNPFRGGALAEIAAVPERQLAVMPAPMSFEEAAALPIAALAAILSIEKLGKTQAGAEVLIHGSSGAVGLFAIQIARQLGARVTAVAGNEGVQASLAMGADEALNYQAGPTQFSRKFDLIVDLSSHFPFARARQHLKPFSAAREAFAQQERGGVIGRVILVNDLTA